MVRNYNRSSFKRPYRRYRKSKSYSSSYKKRYIGKNPSTSVSKMSIMPDRIMVPLQWSENLNVSGSSGVAADRRYAINNLYDPLFETGGDQPTGFDQWATLFNDYKVHSIKIDIEFVNRSATIYPGVGFVINNDSTTLTDLFTQSDNPYSKRKILGINSGVSKCSMGTYVSIKKLVGVDILDESEYSANVAAAPNALVFLHLMTQDSAEAGNTDVMTDIRFTFYTEFSHRKTLNHS